MNKEELMKKPLFLAAVSGLAVLAVSLVFLRNTLAEVAAVRSLRDPSSLEQQAPFLVFSFGILLSLLAGIMVYLLQKRYAAEKRRETVMLEKISSLFEDAPFLFWIKNGNEVIHANSAARAVAGGHIGRLTEFSEAAGDSLIASEGGNYLISFCHKQIGKHLCLGVARAEKVNQDEDSGTVSVNALRHLAEVMRTLRWHLESLLRGNAGKLPKKATAILKENFESHLAMIALAEKIASLEEKEEERVTITLGNLIKSEVVDFKLFAQSRNISFRFSIPDEELPALVLPREKLRIALREFIDNAIRYNSPGGEVLIEVKPEADRVFIRVQDSGMGIPAAEQAHIFKTPLYNKDRKTGGMGLYVAHRHIESLGGTVSYTTSAEGGTLMQVVLPASNEQPMTAASESQSHLA